MKNSKFFLLTGLLFVSLFCNAILCFYLVRTNNPEPSITKFRYEMHDTVVYCDKSYETKAIKLDYDENSFTIGKSKLLNTYDSVYLVTDEKKIRLSDYEGLGFVINSEGKLLYSLVTPAKKQEKVYITPSGKKYHRDKYCAGKTGFEIELDTAQLLREPCNICA